MKWQALRIKYVTVILAGGFFVALSQSAWLTFIFNKMRQKVFMLVLCPCCLSLCHRSNATTGRQTRAVITEYQTNTQISSTPTAYPHVLPLGVVAGLTTCPGQMENCWARQWVTEGNILSSLFVPWETAKWRTRNGESTKAEREILSNALEFIPRD